MAELGQIGAIPVGSMAPSGLFTTGAKNKYEDDSQSEHSSDGSL
jgi:hypothetical protein